MQYESSLPITSINRAIFLPKHEGMTPIFFISRGAQSEGENLVFAEGIFLFYFLPYREGLGIQAVVLHMAQQGMLVSQSCLPINKLMTTFHDYWNQNHHLKDNITTNILKSKSLHNSWLSHSI